MVFVQLRTDKFHHKPTEKMEEKEEIGTIEEFKSIAEMLQTAQKYGLEQEVIWSLVRIARDCGNDITIPEATNAALVAWDI